MAPWEACGAKAIGQQGRSRRTVPTCFVLERYTLTRCKALLTNAWNSHHAALKINGLQCHLCLLQEAVKERLRGEDMKMAKPVVLKKTRILTLCFACGRVTETKHNRVCPKKCT